MKRGVSEEGGEREIEKKGERKREGEEKERVRILLNSVHWRHPIFRSRLSRKTHR